MLWAKAHIQETTTTDTVYFDHLGNCKERLVPIACKWMDVCCAVGLGYHSEPNPNRFSGFACSLCFRCLATLESTDLANTQAIKLSRVLIHVYLCGYCPYGSWYLVSSRDLHVQCVI
ncbi:hypothetical protein NC653_014778 [Populus alba x Populus x berolinensis]|uniref:Uncharacterized protein n=1 Tax=Populus alba x Populus x berolinensis TaxID=444605 RepID=A0AAD6W4U7_9ROSI|nr:hypothetical protein NC653_014778 [Populus alba x Populus x berolinensis]